MPNTLRTVIVAAALASMAAIAAAPASATTFCVPGFHADCLKNGSNVAMTNLETAMNTNDVDGVADRVLVGAMTYTDPDSLQPLGSDPLAVIGSGTGKTRITSSATGNGFVVNLGNRPARFKNLTIVIPASFPDSGGNGSGLQALNSTLDHVNIESLNDRSDAAPSLLEDNTFRDCHFYGAEGDSLSAGVRTNGTRGPGTLRLVRTEIDDATTGIFANTPVIHVRLEKSKISEPEQFAALVQTGGRLAIENSVIEAGLHPAFVVTTTNLSGEQEARLSVASSTIVAKANATDAPLRVAINGPNGADVSVADSIIRGFINTWQVDAPAGPGLGSARLALTDSNFSPVGLPEDSPAVDFSDPGNIDEDPLFAGPSDYRLLAGSPSIDAGSPAPVGPATDFDGRHRPLDGDGNGTAIRDQGAFEFPDKTRPKITKLRAKALKKGKVRISFRSSEAARVIYAFKPVPKKSNGKKRRAPVLKRKVRRGKNILVVKPGKLSKGRYKLRLTAIDTSGNRSVALVKARCAANFVPGN